MKIYLTILLSALFSLTLNAGTSGAKWKDFTQEEIIKHLNTNLANDQIALRVKGLVCESCGIGLRKKLTKLDSVDTTEENKGITMDVYKMLLTVDLKDGKVPTSEELKKAVDDAGYEAVYLYQKKGNKVSFITL